MNNNDCKQVIASVVNSEGKTLDTFYEGESYRKYTEAQKEYSDKYETNFNEGTKFVKLYDEVLDELSKNLSLVEFNFAIRLARHVSYDDCILRTNGHGNGKILDLKDISELLEKDYKTTSRLINSLIKKGVLGKFETGCKENPNIMIKCFICNPYIFIRGTKVNKTVLSCFENNGWKMLHNTTDSEE